ncbi:general odorant-binding protein 56d-like [Periplaneta americana]|uniref:general odorant-binding protein 56d-like n=1 Tax=Periplaneta americana TaxID=6978 RepID=UPI0037E7BF84
MKTKLLFVTVVSLLTCYSLAEVDEVEDEDEISKADIEECQKETGISSEEAQKLSTSKLIQDESNESHRCFIVCIIQKYGLMSNEKLDEELIIKITKTSYEQENKKFGEKKEKFFRKDIKDCNKLGDATEGKCMGGYSAWKCLFMVSIKMAFANIPDNTEPSS